MNHVNFNGVTEVTAFKNIQKEAFRKKQEERRKLLEEKRKTDDENAPSIKSYVTELEGCRLVGIKVKRGKK